MTDEAADTPDRNGTSRPRTERIRTADASGDTPAARPTRQPPALASKVAATAATVCLFIALVLAMGGFVEDRTTTPSVAVGDGPPGPTTGDPTGVPPPGTEASPPPAVNVPPTPVVRVSPPVASPPSLPPEPLALPAEAPTTADPVPTVRPAPATPAPTPPTAPVPRTRAS